MCRDHLLSITLGGGEDFLLGGGYMGVLHGGVKWGCYMVFRVNRGGDQPLLKEHKGGGDYLALTDH